MVTVTVTQPESVEECDDAECMGRPHSSSVLELGRPPPKLGPNNMMSMLIGNTVERDRRIKCAICLDITQLGSGGSGLTNYVLLGCWCYHAATVGGRAEEGHSFHQECLVLLPKNLKE